jgi:hypothetical protein
MKTQTHVFFALLIAAFVFTSCTEAFKKKMASADTYLDEMMATSVNVGTSAETNNGESKSYTSLTFKGCDADLTDAERERRANEVAHGFYKSLTAEDLQGETHLQIISETADNVTYTYLFELEGLKAVDDCGKVAKEMLDACLAQDTSKIRELKDNDFMPDDQMHIIYDVLAYKDSVYAGTTPKIEPLGFRLTDGADDPDLKLYSANYIAEKSGEATLYTINVDRKTNKVVYIWIR